MCNNVAGQTLTKGLLLLLLPLLSAVAVSCGRNAVRQHQAGEEETGGGAPVVLWKNELSGRYERPLTVADGVVYGAEDSDVFALDAGTGETRWQRQLDSFLLSGPVVSDNKLYIAASEGLFALEADSGDELWHFTIAEGMSAPIVTQGMVYAGGSDGRIYAIDAESGEERWNVQVAQQLVATPAFADGLLYVDGDPDAWALDAATGSEKWRFEKSQYTSSSSPVVADGVVFIADIEYLYALDAATGTEVWHYETDDDPVPPPAVASGTLYLSNPSEVDTFYAFDAATGEIRWMLHPGDDLIGEPVVVDGVLYLGGRSLYALDADSGEELWEFDLETPVEGDGQITPTIADGRTYADVCLSRAYESGCEQGNSYVYALEGSGQQYEGEKRLSPESPAPSPPPPVATPTLPASSHNPNATPPVLIDSAGAWTLPNLGYSDIWLDRTSGTIIEQGSFSRLYAPTLQYALPAGASQGPDLWYKLHLHFEVILSDATNTSDKGYQDFTVWGTVGAMGVTMIDFRTVWEGDELVVDCDPGFSCERTEERQGDRVTVRVEGWAYPDGIPDIGVQPGVNSILFAVPYRDLPPRFEALHIFADSFIEVTTEALY